MKTSTVSPLKMSSVQDWIELAMLEFDVILPNNCQLISINDTEFILVPPNNETDPDNQPWGINKYGGIQNNKWQKFIPYPYNYRPGHDMSLCIDKGNQILFIFALYMHDEWAELPCILTILDMKSHTFTHESAPYTGKGWRAVITFAENMVHIIGGYNCNEHFVYNVKTQQFTKLHEFPSISFIYGSAVYLPSKRSILLIGGKTGENTVRIILPDITIKTRLILHHAN